MHHNNDINVYSPSLSPHISCVGINNNFINVEVTRWFMYQQLQYLCLDLRHHASCHVHSDCLHCADA